MAITKSGSRLLLVGAAAVLLVGTGAGVVVWRRASKARDAQAAREAGREAYARGDWGAAVEGLQKYRQVFEREKAVSAEDYLMLARAVRKLPDPSGANRPIAIEFLRRSIALDARDAAAKGELRDLYLDAGQATEGLELIDSMLAANPGDLASLRAKFDVLAAMRQFAKARDVCREINKYAPDDFEGYFRTLEMSIAADGDPAQIDAWVDGVLAAHAKDTRFELLRAAALAPRRDTASAARARECLDRVADAIDEATGRDAAFVQLVLTQLDQAGRFEDSMKLLGRIEKSADAKLRRDLLVRRYYAGRLTEILAQIDALGAEAVAADPELSAIHAVCLSQAGRTDESKRIADRLAAATDRTSKAWSAFLAYSAQGAGTASRGVADALREAVRAVPKSALLHLALGCVTSDIGDVDLAVQSWNEAARRAPSWALPLRYVAESLMAGTGNEATALATAWQAYARAPGDLSVIATLVKAIARDPAKLDSIRRDALLASIDTMHAQAPEMTESLVPSQIEILATVDPHEGEKRIRAEIERVPARSQAVLLSLAATASRIAPALRDDVYAACEKAHGATPALALAKASHIRGDEASGLAVIDQMKSRAAKGTAELDWSLARANYLSSIGSAAAAPAWTSLADANPESLVVQLGALAADAVWKDHTVVARIIGRVREISGPEGSTWRVAHAKLLLADPAASPERLAEAAQTLTNVVQTIPRSLEARVLLSQAFERLENLKGAEEQLAVAGEIAGDNAWISLELARLAQRQGKSDDVRRHLDRALASDALPPALTAQAAYLMATQGEYGKGASLLAPLAGAAPSRASLLLLAQLYAKLGSVERALSVCQRILDGADAPTIQLAAALYASLGKPAEASALLARLDGLDLPAGEREILRAQHAASWQTRDEARPLYAAAARAAPNRADVWTDYIDFVVTDGDAKLFAAILDDPAAKAEPVAFARENREVLGAAIATPELRSLVSEAVRRAPARKPLLDAIRSVTTDWPDRGKRGDVARAVRELAEKNPGVLSLQLLAADRCAQVGDLRGATDVARRAMAAFPDNIAAAWQSAELLAAGGRYADAVDAGLAWRDRSPRGSLAPDVFVARALIRMNRVPDAAASLELKAAEAMAAPDRNAEFLLVYLAALVRSDRAPRASDVLDGLVRASDAWRVKALEVDTTLLGDAERARAWLTICAKHIPLTDAAGRLALARAWGGAWEAHRADVLRDSALAVLAELRGGPVGGESRLVAATLLHQAGELEQARREYEAAIEASPDLVDAHNNLAMLLADRGDWQPAVEHAKKAVSLAPRAPGLLDTLAHALRAGKQYDPAAEALRSAMKLDPTNPAWPIALAETLAANPSPAATAELQKVVSLVDELVARGGRLSASLQKRLEAVRSARR